MAPPNWIVIALNYQGVDFLSIGQYGQAIIAWKNAVNALKTLVGKPPSADESRSSRHDQSRARFQWTQNPAQHTGGCDDSHPNFLPSPETRTDETLFAFRRAIIITPHESETPYYCLEEFSAVLYNYALSHHLLGIENGMSSQYFAHALRLYEMALSLVETNISLACQNPKLIAVAIYNNIGHIQRELGNFEAANESFQHMLTLWTSLQLAGHASYLMDEQDCTDLVLNLIMYAKQPVSAPAA